LAWNGFYSVSQRDRTQSTPPGDEPIDMALIDRYLSGVSTPPERVAVDAWIAASPEHGTVVETLRAILPGEQMEIRARDVALARRVLRMPHPSRAGRSQALAWRAFQAQPLWRRLWSATAAVGLGLIVLVIGWSAGVRHNNKRATQASLIYATGNGERATITLPDGGTVALNVTSRLEVPADYMADNHTVRLVGQGLFTVSHHDGAPLTVLTGGTTTRVLGTTFVVRHYATDTATLVAVRDGKVAVNSLVVTAAHLVEVGRTGVPHVRPSDASPFTFATGVLSIDGLPLAAAIVELDRWYDVDIRLGDPILRTQYMTGRYAAGSPGDLAEILEGTFNVHVVRDGRVLTLFPR
jgi:ferric-dicitrate binding protein FerR (iron transport regulator)